MSVNPNELAQCYPPQPGIRRVGQGDNRAIGKTIVPCDPAINRDLRIIWANGRGELTTVVPTTSAPIRYTASATPVTVVSVTIPLDYTCDWVRIKFGLNAPQIGQGVQSVILQGSTDYPNPNGYTSGVTGQVNSGWIGSFTSNLWIPLPQTTTGGNTISVVSILTAAYQAGGATPIRSLISAFCELEAFIQSTNNPC